MEPIKIQRKDSYIPIEVEGIELRFSLEDDSMLKLRQKMNTIEKEFGALERGEDTEEALDKFRGVLRNAFDEMFEKGTFDKLYKKAPSIMIMTEYFGAIGSALHEELEKRGFVLTPQDKAKEYLAKKTQPVKRKK